MRLSLWVLIFHRVDFSHFILLLSKYWILSIINQALSKTKELPEIESRYFASEEEFPSLLASRQFIKAVILTDVCRYRFYAIPTTLQIYNHYNTIDLGVVRLAATYSIFRNFLYF